jgi:phosphoglycolate phosphatase
MSRNNHISGAGKAFSVFLFDLDGTITDSREGIFNSLEYAFRQLGSKQQSKDFTGWIGPPLIDSFTDFCGGDRECAERALAYYREYYTEKGIFENRLYPGIRDFLSELAKKGSILLLATSKPKPYALQIMDHFDLKKFFHSIHGSTLDSSLVDKESIMGAALEAARPERAGDCLMIGDRYHDMEGARAHGIAFCGVTWGYGSPGELQGADYLVESMEELALFSGFDL